LHIRIPILTISAIGASERIHKISAFRSVVLIDATKYYDRKSGRLIFDNVEDLPVWVIDEPQSLVLVPERKVNCGRVVCRTLHTERESDLISSSAIRIRSERISKLRIPEIEMD
jgi:hypothetical protein